MRPLESQQIFEALRALPEWTYEGGELRRSYRFPSFTHAMAFLAGMATVIEKMNHHPDWSNVYNRVGVRLSTHDAGGVTQLDLDLATQMESLAQRLL
ncbi:MAG: 4a-hydroxytetrahydrobiopterin dehydratase [Acidobacteriota bacterium]